MKTGVGRSGGRASTAPEPVARVRLIGAPQVTSADGAVQELERREAALLALLAIDGPTPRSRAAALLWADADTERQRGSLRQRLFHLKRRARCDIISVGEVLALEPNVVHDLMAIGPRLPDDPDAGRGQLLGAFDYSDCPLLDDWVAAARERWRAERTHALADIAARLEAENRVAAALPYAERLVAEDPTLEHAHRRLMRLHYVRGDRAAALGAFARCQQQLRQLLGARPGAETLELAQLIERSGAFPPMRSKRVPVAILRPPRLVGRDAEWARLVEARAVGRTMLVRGEPGIGKTRLIGDYATSVAGAIVVSTRPGDARFPYALLARIARAGAACYGPPANDWARGELARVVPEFGTPNARALEAPALLQAMSETVAQWADAGLVLLVIDDAQYADEQTLSALPTLATGLAARVVWIVGCRVNEMPGPLADWLDAGDSEGLIDVRLAPLDRAAVSALLQSLELPGLDPQEWTERLVRHTGGNPMFILETLRTLVAQADAPLSAQMALPAPAHIGELIGRRLFQLSAGALGLARVAAIAGEDFTAELAAHALGRAVVDLTDDWMELEAAQVIKDGAFAHDLIYEVASRSLPGAIAEAVHRAVAAFLQGRGAPAARVGMHWRAAGEWDAAAAAFENAADQALQASRREDELEWIRHAVDCAKQAGDGARVFKLQLRSVDALLIVKPVDFALALTERLLAEAKSDAQRLDALLRRTSVLLMATRFADAVAAAQAARALARELGASACELDAVRFEALGLANSGHAPAAVQMLRDVALRFERDGELLQQYQFATDLGHALGLAGAWREAIGAMTRAVELAQRLGDVAETIVNLTNLAGASAYVGRIHDAVAGAEQARALRPRLGTADGTPMAHNDMLLGMLYVASGRYREALQAFANAEQQFRAGGATTLLAVNTNHLGMALIQLGQPGRATRLLTIDDDLPASTRARRLIVLARAAQALGRPGAGRLRDALALLGSSGSTSLRLGAQLDLARELAAADAVSVSREVRAEAERLDLLAIAQHAAIREVECLLRANDAAQAVALAHTMLARLVDCYPADIYLAEGWWVAFRAFDSVPECSKQARATLQRAVAWVKAVAERDVPEDFRDSFLNRNPVNRAILTAATSRRERAPLG